MTKDTKYSGSKSLDPCIGIESTTDTFFWLGRASKTFSSHCRGPKGDKVVYPPPPQYYGGCVSGVSQLAWIYIYKMQRIVVNI